MKYLTICFLLALISCLFILQTDGMFFGKKKEESKGKCVGYKGQCGSKINSVCCKSPYKCGLQTSVCGKDKLCCVTEAEIQRHRQDSASWVKKRNGK